MNHRLKITSRCLSVGLAMSLGAVDLAAAQDTAPQASTSCPMPPARGPATDGASPPAGAPVVIVARTIAPVDSSTSTVISPDIADQITCGKAVIDTIGDVVFGAPTLREGTAKKLAMDIQIPESSGPKPLVVYIPGGGFVRAPKESAINLRTFVAEAGFVVASIQYRTLSDSANYRDSIADVKSAIRHLRAHADEYGIDPGKVAVWGESAGGYLAAMVGVTGEIKSFDVGDNLDQSSAVQAVVDEFGPSDMSKIAADFDSETQRAYSSPRNPLALYINGLASGKSLLDEPTAATTANPLTYVNASAAPFLLFHGSQDGLVSPSQTLLLHNALNSTGAHSTRYVLDGAGHGDMAFLGNPKAGLPWSTNEVMGLIVDFLKSTLR
jgi:acetyl esterase/lipase